MLDKTLERKMHLIHSLARVIVVIAVSTAWREEATDGNRWHS